MKNTTESIAGSPATVINGPENLKAFLAKHMKNLSSGQLTLDEITKNVNIGRYEAIKILKSATVGKLIIGRRGGVSRFVWGQAAKQQPKPVLRQRRSSGVNLGVLRIHAGKFTHEIPVDRMELVER